MDRQQDTTVEALLEHLIEHGPADIATVFGRAFELAMQIERERFLGAGLYERTSERRGYANGYKPKRIDTPAGTVAVDVPKTAGHDGTPFYPQSLERGRRSVRAVMLAVAEMYVKGVSTREAEMVLREFGIESLSSSQVSRAAKLLDEELEAWRTRSLGEVKYLILDARYEKMRHGGVVRDAAVLSAIGIGPDERRRVLGVSVALSEAEVHWRAFLESLQARGMRGVEYVVSTITPGCAPRAGQSSAARRGSGVSSTSPKTPSITRRTSRYASASAPSCARSGTPDLWPRPKPPWPSWSQITATRPRSSPPGWRRTCPRGSPSSPCPGITAGACAPPTPWSALSSRSSSAARARSGSSRTRTPSSASSAPCWSRSTTSGPPTATPTSNGNARMRVGVAEIPDLRLHNRKRSSPNRRSNCACSKKA